MDNKIYFVFMALQIHISFLGQNYLQFAEFMQIWTTLFQKEFLFDIEKKKFSPNICQKFKVKGISNFLTKYLLFLLIHIFATKKNSLHSFFHMTMFNALPWKSRKIVPTIKVPVRRGTPQQGVSQISFRIVLKDKDSKDGRYPKENQ